jgi:hypothetical protein
MAYSASVTSVISVFTSVCKCTGTLYSPAGGRPLDVIVSLTGFSEWNDISGLTSNY